MSVVLLLLLIDVTFSYEFPNVETKNDELVTCVINVIEKYSEKEYPITYINMNADGTHDLIKGVSESTKNLIITRNAYGKLAVANKLYLIEIQNEFEFVTNYKYLRRDGNWNALAKFVLVIDSLGEAKLDDIFRVLHRIHVINVIIINGTSQADVYTYDPFENNGCGKYYDKFISYGPCLTSTEDFFPEKHVNGFKGCTLTMAVAHIPPYSFHPNRCDLKGYRNCMGIEQYVFQLLSEKEQFKPTYVYVDFAELFSVVDSNMIADGYFTMIQNNETDGLFGFSVLNKIRSQAFDYVYSHLAMTDEVVYIVKRSGRVPTWKNIYSEFDCKVWILIFLSFTFCAIIAAILTKQKDKFALFLKMWDSFFLHGFTMNSRFGLKIFFFTWIWFTYLINSFYQSSLMSLTVNPSDDYQVSSVHDLKKFDYKPCVVDAMRKFLESTNMKFKDEIGECDSLVRGIEKVSNSYGIYTIGSKTIYAYNIALFRDERGHVKTFHIKKSILNLIYAMYFYKGFPLSRHLGYRCMQLHESGLITRYSRVLFQERWKHYAAELHDEFQAQMVLPWGILIIGFVLSTIVFILELFYKGREENAQMVIN